jgi:RNA polymerase sigma-70 factor (ECF subfamily)
MDQSFLTAAHTTRDLLPPEALEDADDLTLLKHARRHDPIAFGILYQRYVGQVYRYIASRTQRQDVAEDLTSEVFLNAWRSVERYEDRGFTAGTWFMRLARHEVID